jgi:toxin FitB
MIILDTNVISELMAPRPNILVLRWMDSQPISSIWVTSVNIYEVRSGLQSMPAGKRQSALATLFEEWLADVLQRRILSFDEAAAEYAAVLVAERKKKGRPGDPRDTMIAGIVLATHGKLATRNVKHFEDIAKSVVNPWEKS